MKDFAGRVAAITGASSGIGRALALELARRGCHLALSSYSNQAALAETAELAARHGVKVTRAKVNVADRGAVHAWAEDVVQDHGAVNLVINNAGVAFGGLLSDASYDDLEWVMNINFWGVVHGTKAFLPHLVASGEGHVVNVSSIFGMIAQAGHGPYNASKFAVRGFTESLRQELDLLRHGVSATCVLPGGVKTNVVAASRFSESYRVVSGTADVEESRADFERLFRTTPEEAAKVTLRAVERDARRVLIGGDAYFADIAQRVLPAAYQSFMQLGLKVMKAIPRRPNAQAATVVPEVPAELSDAPPPRQLSLVRERARA